ncbi:ABC transporter permease [Gemmatimonas phototrophica]|uniref:ABC transporter permease n=2 Tax=Gemmatimonas phototrophica TaxID=1379270 RepID=A0A143BQS6_9BACT|nr:ABC transporter permease [Gemmatimonas phototrophica]
MRTVAWGEAAALFRQYRTVLLGGIALTLVGRLAGLVLPASSRWFIDHVLVERRTELLIPLALTVLGATAVQALSAFLVGQWLGVTAQRVVSDWRRRLAAHVLRLPTTYFESVQTGALTSRILSDPDGIRNLIGSGFVQLVGNLITSLAAFGVLMWLDWRMTLVMLLFMALIGAGVAYAFAQLRPVNRARSVAFAKLAGRLGEALGGIRVVKTYVAERREDVVFTRGAHAILRLVARTVTGWSLVSSLTTLAVGGISATLIVFGGRAVLAGSLTVGELAMYALFTGLAAAPLIQVAQIGTQLSDAIAGLERARELLDQPTEDQLATGQAAVPPLTGHVRMEHVSFAYQPGVPVLRDISFDAPAGSTTALVGASGSGKSTLLGLLATFHQPASGRIVVDGLDLSTLSQRGFRSQVGIVLQDTVLFDDTIRENIRFARPGASNDDVDRVAALAHCDEFITRLPNGFDTVVGERGVKLSGGQRQRVAIARALLADPAILLLDEATSSLDSESEARIQAGLERLRAGRTTFVIAHRLSTIVGADQILVLEHGAIIERGAHDTLLAQQGRYAQLYAQQQRVVRERFVNPGEELAAL